jgi:hypothetical protein
MICLFPVFLPAVVFGPFWGPQGIPVSNRIGTNGPLNSVTVWFSLAYLCQLFPLVCGHRMAVSSVLLERLIKCSASAAQLIFTKQLAWGYHHLNLWLCLCTASLLQPWTALLLQPWTALLLQPWTALLLHPSKALLLHPWTALLFYPAVLPLLLHPLTAVLPPLILPLTAVLPTLLLPLTAVLIPLLHPLKAVFTPLLLPLTAVLIPLLHPLTAVLRPLLCP